jgi:hypothetical protein
MTQNAEDSAEAIRARMAELRRELTYDVNDVSRSVREVGRSAREMVSPGYVIRNYPWLSAAAAVAVGYLLVPKKKQVVQPDPEMLAELVRKEQIKVDTSKASNEKRGLLQTLAIMGITWAARTGMNYAVQRATAAAMNKPPAPASGSGDGAPMEQPSNTVR